MLLELKFKSMLEKKSTIGDRTVSISELIREIAYHEASHFVFDMLVSEYIPNFMEPTSINFTIEEQEYLDTSVNIRHPYLRRGEDNKKVFCLLISLLSGCYSYKVFIDEKERNYFTILKSRPIDKHNIVEHNSLEYWIENSNLPNVRDVTESVKFIGYLKSNQGVDNQKIIQFICDKILNKLFLNHKILEAIEYTREKLQEFNGTRIAGSDLDSIKSKNEDLLKDVNLSSMFKQFEESLDKEV